MASWNASYEMGKSYEINFCSVKYEEAKAVEKVCCAIMDKEVTCPNDIEVVRHGKWIEEKTQFEDDWGVYNYTWYLCSECKNREMRNLNYCPHCGAKKDGE